MSEFFDDLGRELEAAAGRRARRPGPRFAASWSRRTVGLAAAATLAIIAVPAAAVTGVFSSSAPPRPDPTQPGLVDVGPPCVSKTERKLQTTSEAPPAEVTALLAVLRRPQRPSDRLPKPVLQRLAMLPVESVNPDAIRLAVDKGDTRVLLVPSANVRYFPALSDDEACNPPNPTPAPGVCLVERRGSGAATCSDVDAIRRGLTMLTTGGRRHGLTHVAGIAHDGVSAVIWRVHRGNHFLDTRIPVHNNVYAATVPGRAGHGLYVFFETPEGRKLVRGPHHYTKRELAQMRLDKQRDANATGTPTVFPRAGGAKAIFVLRMRVAPTNKVYVATWKAPAACASGRTTSSIGMTPALRGANKGLIKAAFGPLANTRRWCPGTYTGTIRTQRRGQRDVSGPVIARFSFTVRGG